MSTTAILTYANRMAFQMYNAAGDTLVGAIYNLQATKISPKKTTPKIDFTNSESPPRRREFAPGNQEGTFTIEGIFDFPPGGILASAFDTLFTDVMDAGLYVMASYWIMKPTVGKVPLVYSAKTLFTDCDINSEVTGDGSVLKFTATGTTIGGFSEAGADVVFVSGL